MCCKRICKDAFNTLRKAQEFVDREVRRKTIRYYDKEINKLRFEKNLRKRLIRYRSLCKLKSQALELLLGA